MPAKLDYTADGTPFWQADPNDTVDNVLYQQPSTQVTVNPIATQQPLPIDLTASNLFTAGISAFKNLTTDTATGERIQTWPERLARSAISLPVDVMQGNVLSGPGLRREDFTDEPIPTTPTKDSTWLGNKLGLAPIAAQPLDPMIERAQDMAGLAGGSTLAVKPGTASVGSGLIRPMENELMTNAPTFYSAVENAVKNSKQNVATADQWLGYLKNQPGVKQEELDWTLGSLPQGKITKAELEQHIADHKVELKEVNKGGNYNIENIRKLEAEREQVRIDLDNARKNNKNLTGKEREDNINRMKKLADRDEAIVNEIGSSNNTPTITKYHSYQLPGGDNYREMLLTLPEQSKQKFINEYKKKTGIDISNYNDEQINRLRQKTEGIISDNTFKSSHWDESNVLAHIRMNDRIVDVATPEMISDIGKRMAEALNVSDVKHLGSGAAKLAVKKGAITEAEAAEYSRAKGWLNGYEDKPGIGKKTLHIEEVQSDWHQKGRKEGYKGERDFQKLNDDLEKARSNLSDIMHEIRKENNLPSASEAIAQKLPHEEIANLVQKRQDTYEKDTKYNEALAETKRLEIETAKAASAVPNAPFKKNWDELALKKIIRHAAENGYDAISWTPGEAQAARYDLSKQISKITYNAPGSKMADKYGTVLKAFDHNGHEVINKNLKPEELPDAIGKEAAEKLLKTEPSGDKHELSGLDLKVGGEGMKGFYDKILVDRMNNIAKKFGSKVESKNIGKTENTDYRIENDTGKFDNDRHANGINKYPHAIYFTNLRGEKRFLSAYATEKEATEALAKLNADKQPIHYLPLTPGLKDTALRKGFPLFSAGISFSPIEHNPFVVQPVDHDPFEEKKK